MSSSVPLADWGLRPKSRCGAAGCDGAGLPDAIRMWARVQHLGAAKPIHADCYFKASQLSQANSRRRSRAASDPPVSLQRLEYGRTQHRSYLATLPRPPISWSIIAVSPPRLIEDQPLAALDVTNSVLSLCYLSPDPPLAALDVTNSVLSLCYLSPDPPRQSCALLGLHGRWNSSGQDHPVQGADA